MSGATSPRRQLRAFLTQSAHSTGTSRRPTTACTGTVSCFESVFDTELTIEEVRPATSVSSNMITLPATVDDAKLRMLSLRRLQALKADELSRMSRRSGELRNYSRERFLDRIQANDSTQAAARKLEPARPPRPSSSRCILSPYVTIPKPTDVGDGFCCEAASTVEELENGRSRSRAQLMSQLRLHQPTQSVRFRHDRTAQELAQEGSLPSRSLCEAFPWQPGYKYTPYPTPKLLEWTRDEAARRLERQRLAEEFDRVETPKPAATPPTPPTSPPALPPTNPIVHAPIEPTASTLVAHTIEPPTKQQQQQQQQQRPKSGRVKGGRRGHQKQQQQQLTPEQQALLLEQQLAEKAAARRRNFSVSTIGEEELAQSRIEQQRLLDVCQRLRDRQLAREAAAAAAAAAEAALKAAAEAALAPPAPAPPPPPPPPPPQSDKTPRKKRSGSAGSAKKKKSAGQEKPKSKSRSPRSASSGSGKTGKAGSSGTQSRSSSVSGETAQPKPTDAIKKANQQQQQQPKKASPRAKSPKGGKKGPVSKKGKTAQKKAPAASSTPQPPPQPPQETQPVEPPGPDPIDLLADEIEAAQVFHRTKAPGELPDFPCPSSEGKSRQQLTKVWWQRQAMPIGGLSLIT